MYAIIEVGAKQYKVKEKDLISVETQDQKPGKEFAIGKVLLVKDGKDLHVGKPHLKDHKVLAKVVKEIRGEKLISFKYRRRKDSRWKKGHRQNLSVVEIVKIGGGTEEKHAHSEKKETVTKTKESKK